MPPLLALPLQLRAVEDGAAGELEDVDTEKGRDARSVYERNLKLQENAEEGIYKGMGAYHSYTKKSDFLSGPGGAPKSV